MNGEIQHMKSSLVEFVDHEPHNPFIMFGNHSDAVALAETAYEVFLRPGELEAPVLNLQNFGHIPPNHPSDVDANFLFPLGAHAGFPP
jgi:hypothetical protein